MANEDAYEMSVDKERDFLTNAAAGIMPGL